MEPLTRHGGSPVPSADFLCGEGTGGRQYILKPKVIKPKEEGGTIPSPEGGPQGQSGDR
jgi:hypothetical protein